MLDCYIINLDKSIERWNYTSEKFRSLGLNVLRVPAIEGKDLTFPHPDFAAWRYFFWYGRKMIPNKVACFFSHIKALRNFLDSEKEHAMICEDDVIPCPELMEIVETAMRYSDHWDLLRLNGIKPTRGWDFAELPYGYRLGCDLKTASGNGGKIVNRRAAEKIIKQCLPMRLPHDVTLFYDLPIGIREVSIRPFPIQLNDVMSKASSIGDQPPHLFFHPLLLAHLTKLPYKIITRSIRKISRIRWAIQNSFFPPKLSANDLVTDDVYGKRNDSCNPKERLGAGISNTPKDNNCDKISPDQV